MDVKEFAEKLIREDNVVEFCGVSDSTLKALIKEVEGRGMYTPFTNEADAVAYAAGRSCCPREGKVAVLLQNSGLTNASSPISSLTALYKIPMIFIVGMRGGSTPDEPQHEIVGHHTLSMIRAFTDWSSTVITVNQKGYLTDKYGSPGLHQKFYLVERGAFETPSSEPSVPQVEDNFPHYDLLRPELISNILKVVKGRDDVVILSTTGYTSRELMYFNDDSRNFYMLGSMGCLAAFAEGVVNSCPHKKVIILDGDGSFLMHPEGLMHLRSRCSGSYFYIMFDNGSHLSTGGQKLPTEMIDLVSDSLFTYTIKKHQTDDIFLSVVLEKWLNGETRCESIRACVESSSRDDLPRPSLTPSEIYDRFKRCCDESNHQ